MATGSAKLFNRVAEVCFAGLLERDKLKKRPLAAGHCVIVLIATPHHRPLGLISEQVGAPVALKRGNGMESQ
jgi:hypothetical protein